MSDEYQTHTKDTNATTREPKWEGELDKKEISQNREYNL